MRRGARVVRHDGAHGSVQSQPRRRGWKSRNIAQRVNGCGVKDPLLTMVRRPMVGSLRDQAGRWKDCPAARDYAAGPPATRRPCIIRTREDPVIRRKADGTESLGGGPTVSAPRSQSASKRAWVAGAPNCPDAGPPIAARLILLHPAGVLPSTAVEDLRFVGVPGRARLMA